MVCLSLSLSHVLNDADEGDRVSGLRVVLLAAEDEGARHRHVQVEVVGLHPRPRGHLRDWSGTTETVPFAGSKKFVKSRLFSKLKPIAGKEGQSSSNQFSLSLKSFKYVLNV